MGPKLGKVNGNEIMPTQNDVLRDPGQEKTPHCERCLSNEKGMAPGAGW